MQCALGPLLFAVAVYAGDSGRVVVPFNYAWRFHYGDDPTSPPGAGPNDASTTAFPEDLTGYPLCDGIEHAPNRFSLKDCRLACAYDPTCMVWQAFPLEYGRSCYQGYAGMNITCTKAAKGKETHMGGGRRTKTPDPPFRTDYPFAVADARSDVDQLGGGGWTVIDTPHDFIAERANFTNNIEDFKQGYLPRNASWYRKHFHLPVAWANATVDEGGDGGATFVHFEGVFHHATIFLNGHYLMSHECGYTGFDVRLDNATGVRFGEGTANENVLTVRADASFGSGHWYEGGGIYRPVHLVHVAPLHVVRDGLFVPPGSDGTAVRVSAELESTASAEPAALVSFTLFDTDGTTVLASASSAPVSVPASSSGTVLATATLSPPAGSIKRWSTDAPTLYTLRAQVARGVAPNAIIDELSVSNVGFRTTTFSAGEAGAAPFKLNDKPFAFRGFSHHNSIGGLGVAIPERIELFRVQASRALGSNIWRMSHNPYAPALYELLDATGQMCWDENRDYGAKYGDGAYAVAMRDMVKRDRNHPSVILWSFCNELECLQNDHDYSGRAFRAAAYGVDGTRPVTANGSPSQVPVAQVDVQGGSHWSNKSFISAHALNGTKPLVLSECCSCTSQRPDRSLPSCIGDQNSPGRLPYVTGSLGVWTLMDYFGEPHGTGSSGWPYVSCDFGQFDIAGYPKPHAFWYVANWAQGFDNATQPGRPPLPVQTVTRFLDLPHATGNGTNGGGGVVVGGGGGTSGMASSDATPLRPALSKHTLYSITSAPFSELLLDGVSQGVQPTPRNARGEIEPTAWSLSAGVCTGADAASFPVNASNVQCHDLTHRRDAVTADACAKVCCSDATCNTWQLDTTKAGCWTGRAVEGVGKCGAPKQPGAMWLGGQRNVPGPAPTPAPASPYKNGTLVARAGPSTNDAALGSHSVFAPGSTRSSHRLQLTLDVPAASTGTGDALLLDGRDTALLRISVVDSANYDALVADATDRVRWRVVTGPGRLAGVANGDPTSHEWMKSDAVNTYLGLARGLVQVTQDCTTIGRELAATTVDVDAAHGPTTVLASGCDEGPIVVEASAAGFASVRIDVPVSVDVAKDGVMAVAKSTASALSFSYLDDFVG